jgi:cytochrome c oxidase subunit 2
MAANRNLVTLAALLLAAVAPGGPARAADDKFGAEEFELCAQCHGPEGGGNQAAMAPAIAGLPEWYILAQLADFKGGLRGLHPDDTGGLRMYPMSQYLKTEADVKAVATHVAGLPPAHPAPVLEGGDAQKGAALYTPCAACHGPDGGGNQAVNAPPLRGASDWYLLSSLEKFKAGIRGGNPQNTYAALMRGMSQMLTDQQAMKDVVAYIGSLSKQTAANTAK